MATHAWIANLWALDTTPACMMNARRALTWFAALCVLALLAWRATHWFALYEASDVDLATYDYDLNDYGRLFLMQKVGMPDIYLFGTMHSNDPRVLELPPSVENALGASSVFAAETRASLSPGLYGPDPQDYGRAYQEYQTLCFPPDSRSLRALVDDDLFERVVSRFDELTLNGSFGDISKEQIGALSIWCAASSLASSSGEWRRQHRGAEILDNALLRDAARMGKQLVRLESFDEQNRFILEMPAAYQIEDLEMTLDNFGFVSMDDAWETWISEYLAGDNRTSPDLDALQGYEAYIWREQFIARNRRMAAAILDIADDGVIFASVGAGHLPGEEGLVNLLVREGYTATVLEPPL